MTKLELQEAIDVIREAFTATETYPEQFLNDQRAQIDLDIIEYCMAPAERAARRIIDKIDAWSDAATAIAAKDDAELRRLQREQSGV